MSRMKLTPEQTRKLLRLVMVLDAIAVFAIMVFIWMRK